MKNLILLIGLIIGSMSLNAQDVVLEESVPDSLVEPKFGPNYRHFIHTFYNFGVMVTESAEATAVKAYKSGYQLPIGIRYKYKLNNHVALGTDIYYKWSWIYFDTERSSSSVYTQEMYNIGSWGLSPYLRINVGKRGNTLGKFIDLFAYGDINSMRHYFYEQETNSLDPMLLGNYAEKVEVNYKKLSFMNTYNYGAGVRIGWKSYSFFAQYRLNELLLENEVPANLNAGEVPMLLVGFELGL
ncbi:MAG: outer membrane beta-barrel protein [Bacteroidales bacterium]|nr:outer membrane beta-barrel protein [Bacteroidales bacterium]